MVFGKSTLKSNCSIFYYLNKKKLISAQKEHDIYKACEILKEHNLHRLVIYDDKE